MAKMDHLDGEIFGSRPLVPSRMRRALFFFVVISSVSFIFGVASAGEPDPNQMTETQLLQEILSLEEIPRGASRDEVRAIVDRYFQIYNVLKAKFNYRKPPSPFMVDFLGWQPTEKEHRMTAAELDAEIETLGHFPANPQSTKKALIAEIKRSKRRMGGLYELRVKKYGPPENRVAISSTNDQFDIRRKFAKEGDEFRGKSLQLKIERIFQTEGEINEYLGLPRKHSRRNEPQLKYSQDKKGLEFAEFFSKKGVFIRRKGLAMRSPTKSEVARILEFENKQSPEVKKNPGRTRVNESDVQAVWTSWDVEDGFLREAEDFGLDNGRKEVRSLVHRHASVFDDLGNLIAKIEGKAYIRIAPRAEYFVAVDDLGPPCSGQIVVYSRKGDLLEDTGLGGGCISVRFSPKGNFFATDGTDGTIASFARSGQKMWVKNFNASTSESVLLVTDQGEVLTSAGKWINKTGATTWSLPRVENLRARDVGLLNNGRLLLIGKPGRIDLHDARTGELIEGFLANSYLNGFEFVGASLIKAIRSHFDPKTEEFHHTFFVIKYAERSEH